MTCLEGEKWTSLLAALPGSRCPIPDLLKAHTSARQMVLAEMFTLHISRQDP